jgi:hypothetical protein
MPRRAGSCTESIQTPSKDAYMVRNGLLALPVAVLLIGLALPLGSAQGEDAESRLRTQLAVQRALQQGREELQRGNYMEAVKALEAQIARVDGNRDYLNVLREAYRGAIHELRRTKPTEARIYQRRLELLEPDARSGPKAERSIEKPTIAALASQTPPKPVPVITARPQKPEDPDPFADANSVSNSEAGDLIAQANREFDKKNYFAAGRLYEQANRLDTHATGSTRDQWAYCKLYRVVDSLNKNSGSPSVDLDGEVRAALALTRSAEMENYGKKLLQEIRKRREGVAERDDASRIEVRHVPARPPNWAEAVTTNFRVLHNQSRELAENVARIAEKTRSTMTRKWFGEEPRPWDRKCIIVLYANARDYATDTGQPQWLDGHSTLKRDEKSERILNRRIDLHCDVVTMTTKVLPHETTHAVLAGRFGANDVPRWVDEGIAVLAEPREQVERHLNNLSMHRSKRELFGVAQLMTLKDYPERQRTGAFYAQSISLVEFLSSQKGGAETLTRFVRDGLREGYETALQKHYGFKDFSDLQQRWERSAFDFASSTAAYRSRP